MSSTTPPPARDGDPADRSHLTVEDAGSTTDAGTLAHDDPDEGTSTGSSPSSGDDVVAVAVTAGDRSGAPDTSGSPDDRATAPTERAASESATASGRDGASAETSSAPTGGLAALIGDESVGHVFDQTNGVIDGLDGDSDGTADSDVHAASERTDENPAFEQFADSEATSSPDTDDTRRTGA